MAYIAMTAYKMSSIKDKMLSFLKIYFPESDNTKLERERETGFTEKLEIFISLELL